MITTKIMQCKDMLEAAKRCFAPVAVLHCKKVDESKVKQKMAHYRADFEGYLRTVQYGLAIMMLRCCGTSWVKMSGEPPKDAEPICGIPANIVYGVSKKYGQVSANDIETEFLANVTAPDTTANCAALYFGVLDGLLQWPKLQCMDADKIVEDSAYLQSLIKVGCISDYEAYLFARDIVRLAEAYKNSVSAICGVKMKYCLSAKGTVTPKQYPESLVKLFNGHTDYIDKLAGLTLAQIVANIKEWTQLRYKDGKFICQNPASGNKSAYARALIEAGFTNRSEDWIARKFKANAT